MFPQIGGGKCSICGSPGTNKTTCPCNPQATNPNYAKHPNWVETCPGKAPAKALAEAQVASAKAKPKALAKALAKAQVAPAKAKPKALAKAQAKEDVSRFRLEQLKAPDVVEGIILSLSSLDDIKAFCKSNPEFLRVCQKSKVVQDHIKKLVSKEQAEILSILVNIYAQAYSADFIRRLYPQVELEKTHKYHPLDLGKLGDLEVSFKAVLDLARRHGDPLAKFHLEKFRKHFPTMYKFMEEVTQNTIVPLFPPRAAMGNFHQSLRNLIVNTIEPALRKKGINPTGRFWWSN